MCSKNYIQLKILPSVVIWKWIPLFFSRKTFTSKSQYAELCENQYIHSNAKVNHHTFLVWLTKDWSVTRIKMKTGNLKFQPEYSFVLHMWSCYVVTFNEIKFNKNIWNKHRKERLDKYWTNQDQRHVSAKPIIWGRASMPNIKPKLYLTGKLWKIIEKKKM